MIKEFSENLIFYKISKKIKKKKKVKIRYFRKNSLI